MKKYYLVLIFTLASTLALATAKAALQEDHGGGHEMSGKLEQGHYVGYLKVDDQNQKFALEADFFIESPEDLTQFPKLNTILKMSLGGYNSTEYVTQVYKDVRYDFDNNVLTLDEPSNDLVVTAQVHSMNGRTRLQGKVWIRSAAKSATLNLELESDEPGKMDEPGNPSEDNIPFVPNIVGQYVGRCEGKKAVFQIQATRGLRNQDSREGKYLFDYEVVGSLGYWETDVKASKARPWTLYSSFSGGVYDIFMGKLFFLGPSSTGMECKIMNGNLSCDYQPRENTIPCEFELEKKTIQKPNKFQRGFHLNPTTEQLRDLPPATPPSNTELIKALGGHFVGYLHHEAYDRYQPVALHVVPTSSTENPHNPNKIFISTTSVLYFGRTPSDLFITQRYEPRSFYIRPGFTLSAPGTDSYIIIDEWKNGFVRGVWYSHGFGRVGTIELIKENSNENKKETPVSLPLSAKVVQPWQGEFRGDQSPDDKKVFRWFNIIFPNQPSERLDSTVLYAGSYIASTTISPRKQMERGRYDPYTGAMGWLVSEHNGIGMVSGSVEDDGSISLYWPPPPKLFQAAMGNYKLETYKFLK